MASDHDFYREGLVYFQNGEKMDNRKPDAPSTFWGEGKPLSQQGGKWIE